MVLNENDRFHLIMQTLTKLNKNKDAIAKVIASYQGKDESFMISINRKENDSNISKINSQRASKSAFAKVLRSGKDENKRKWTFKRHKFKGSKEGSVELTDAEIIWNGKHKIKLTDLKQIMLGKQSNLLSDASNKHFNNKPNEIFISFISDKQTFDLSETQTNDRMDLMFKVLAKLRQIDHKKFEGDVDEQEIMRRSSADTNYNASIVIVDESEEEEFEEEDDENQAFEEEEFEDEDEFVEKVSSRSDLYNVEKESSLQSNIETEEEPVND